MMADKRSARQIGFPRITIALLLLVYVLAGHTNRAHSQGQDEILPTVPSHPMQSIGLPLTIPSLSLQPILLFDFGFSTHEFFLGGRRSDSFSFTLQSSDGLTTALILTADQTGVNWAPPNPGGVFISPDEISRTSIAVPGFAQGFGTRFAYSASFPLPAGFTSGPVTLQIDLFDNQNALSSVGWVGNVAVVPEPSVIALGLLGAVLVILRNKSRR
jgi:hypothetical protein